MEKCVACQFYDRQDVHAEENGVRWGKCRRSGPLVHPVAAKAYIVEGIWPHVRDDDWCGEWVVKRKPDGAVTDPRNLMVPSPAAAGRTTALPIGSLMTNATPANDTNHIPILGQLGSD